MTQKKFYQDIRQIWMGRIFFICIRKEKASLCNIVWLFCQTNGNSLRFVIDHNFGILKCNLPFFVWLTDNVLQTCLVRDYNYRIPVLPLIIDYASLERIRYLIMKIIDQCGYYPSQNKNMAKVNFMKTRHKCHLSHISLTIHDCSLYWK